MKEKESQSNEAEAIIQAGTHAEAIAHLYKLVGRLADTLKFSLKCYDTLKGDLSNVQSQANDLIFEVKKVSSDIHAAKDVLRESLKAMTGVFLQELRREREDTLERLRVVIDQD